MRTWPQTWPQAWLETARNIGDRSYYPGRKGPPEREAEGREGREAKEPEAMTNNTSSRRIDQFRRAFIEWVDCRLQQLEQDRTAAVQNSELLTAMGIAIRMDELELVKAAALPMTR